MPKQGLLSLPARKALCWRDAPVGLLPTPISDLKSAGSNQTWWEEKGRSYRAKGFACFFFSSSIPDATCPTQELNIGYSKTKQN